MEEELPTSLFSGIRGGIPGVAAQRRELGMPNGKIGTIDLMSLHKSSLSSILDISKALNTVFPHIVSALE